MKTPSLVKGELFEGTGAEGDAQFGAIVQAFDQWRMKIAIKT